MGSSCCNIPETAPTTQPASIMYRQEASVEYDKERNGENRSVQQTYN